MPLHLVKRVKAFTRKPEYRMRELMPSLVSLRYSLADAHDLRDPLTGIVKFFNETSRWHDQGLGRIMIDLSDVNHGQYTNTLYQLASLNQHIIKAGRDTSGVNRTLFGEKVTDDKVFLGGIYGLLTKPVSFWKQQKDSPKGTFADPGLKHMNGYDVVSAQALSFISGHALPMIEIIKLLERRFSQTV